jgi:hypothetical protein
VVGSSIIFSVVSGSSLVTITISSGSVKGSSVLDSSICDCVDCSIGDCKIFGGCSAPLQAANIKIRINAKNTAKILFTFMRISLCVIFEITIESNEVISFFIFHAFLLITIKKSRPSR